VAKPLLERAFQDTYGLRLAQVLVSIDLTIGSYRRAVGTILPAMTRVAWQIRKQEIRKDAPSTTRKTFLYNLSRSSYKKNWGSTYREPGIRSKLLATVFRVLPKVGPWRPLSFKRLTPEIEKMYMASFNATIERYRELLSEQNAGRLNLPNDNLDVGTITAAGKYRLMDAAYSQLLHRLQGRYTEMPQELRSDILAFYRDAGAPNATQNDDKDWARVLKELDELRAANLDPARNGAPNVVSGGLRGPEVLAGVGASSLQ
jgi:hypothetical protein